MLGGFLFGFWRFCEVVTLIPVVGMLSYFVNGYAHFKIITPTEILTLFIVSVLALTWAVLTWFRMSSTRRSAGLVAFIDLLFFGGLIAGAVELGPISKTSCSGSHFVNSAIYEDIGPPFGVLGWRYGGKYYDPMKTCEMLKASFALGIMNAVFFFFTFVLAMFLRRHRDREVVREKEVVVKRRRHRRSGGSRSGSRSGSRRGGSRV